MVRRAVVERYEVVLEPDEDGGYHIFAPALKGCHSWGETREEALEHVKEAISLWIESAQECGIPIPDRELVEIVPD